MKYKILYIYGYNSSSNSNTFKWLKEHLQNTDMYSISYDQENPSDSIDKLCDYILENTIDIIIGSSLGGWYAMHLGTRFSLPCILINPVTDLTLKSTLELVTNNNFDFINKYIEYIKENPLFQDKEHWNCYLWDKYEDGDYSIVLLSDSDEVIKSTSDIDRQLKNNFPNLYIIPNGKHQLNNKEKEMYLLSSYNKLVNEIIPKMNYFYNNANIIP